MQVVGISTIDLIVLYQKDILRFIQWTFLHFIATPVGSDKWVVAEFVPQFCATESFTHLIFKN